MTKHSKYARLIEAAAFKKIDSPIAARANVLIVPDLEAGNMLAKILVALARRTALSKAVG